MFGSCAPGFFGKTFEGKQEANDGRRRPRRFEGQRRELLIKLAERVSHQILQADIAEIEEGLSDEEREFATKAAERAEDRRRKEEEMKAAAVRNAVSSASGKLGGSLFGRVQGLAKLQEAAKIALATEMKQLGLAVRGGSGEQASLADAGSANSDNVLKMPVPAASSVVVKVLHPCPTSLLRSKLSASLYIPLEEVRIVHCGRALKDTDLVPDDAVDLGEEGQLDELGTGQGFDLSFLWVVDTRNVGPPSPPSSQSATTCKASGAESERERAREEEKKQKPATAGDDNSDTSNSDDGGTAWAAEKEVEGERGEVGERATAATPQHEPAGSKRQSDDEVDDTDKVVDSASDPGAEVQSKTNREGEGGKSEGKTNMLATASNHEHEETKNGGAAGNSEPQKPSKKGKKRVVPGSLLMESISAAGLPEAGRELLSKQGTYLVLKWANQDARTSLKRGFGKECSWSKEELVLLVRATKQLREDVEVEVWNDNAGDKKPRPDVLKGRGCLSVAHLMNERAATGSDGVDASRTRARGDKPNAPSADEDVVGVSGKEVITVALVRGGRSRWKAKPAGAVTLTLSYTPPRKKASAVRKEVVLNVTTDDLTATDEEEDGLGSLTALSAWSTQENRTLASFQELGAVMSQTLEGFNIREELRKINCSRYAQGLINEGFGQRGALAHIREEHLARYPMYIPRGPRKRLLALSELIRLQMKAEEGNVVTAMETIRNEGAFNETYTVDGEVFFDTRAAMNAGLEEQRLKGELESGGLPDDDEGPKSPKPRSAAKEKVIRAIEAAADAEERGIYRTAFGSQSHGGESGGDRGDAVCCEKHAFRIQRSAVHMVEERVKDTRNKLDTWLDEADRFKNGVLPPDTARTVMRDAFILNGLPSPRDSDVKISLEQASHNRDGLQFDRGKLAMELERLVRRELCAKAGVPCSFSKEAREDGERRKDRLWGRD